MKAPTTDQLRAAIDSGSTGEKVDMFDPAAAPLGTDDEAAGATPTAAERLLAASTLPRHPHGTDRGVIGGAIYIGLMLAIVAAVVIIVTLAAR